MRLGLAVAAVVLIVVWSLVDVLLDAVECATGRWLP